MRSFISHCVAVVVVGACGCSSSHAPNADPAAEAEETYKKALAELPAEDRAAAAAQRWCVAEQDNRLGSMGTPVKLTLDGKPVFLCCEGCRSHALADEKATLKTVETLKDINEAFGKLSPADRTLAERQRFCAVNTGNRLGSMGPPDKVVLEGQEVFLCCKGCEEDAKAKPKDTLAAAEKLKKSSPAP
jgi:hypothetical protein